MDASGHNRGEGWVREFLRLSVILSFACYLLPMGTAWSAARQFIPKYVDFSADLGVGGLYEESKVKSTFNSTNTDYILQEGLNVQGLGYIYSPLFISMSTTVGLGLLQERVEQSNGRDDSTRGWATSFKQEFKVLPSHPYNLELYFLRATPMTGGRAGSSGSVVVYEHGARALYDQRPWSTSLTYTNRENEADTVAEFETILYNLHYFQTGTSVSGSYSYTDSSREDGQDNTTRDLFNLGLNKEFKKVRFNTRWSYDEQDEDDTFSLVGKNKSNLKREEFYSELAIDLPKNFDTLLSYNKSDKSSFYLRENRQTQSFTDSEHYNFRLHHRLYKSLSSSFSAGYHSTEAIGGNLDQQNYRLSFDYSKKIPWGTVLVGLFKGISYIENAGAPTTLFETHSIDKGNFFNLNYVTIDTNTIEVSVIDFNDNNRQYLLQEGVHYQVTRFANHFRISITNLPFDNLEDPVGIVQDYLYRVDYAFIPADYDLTTENWGTSLQVPLYDNLISPHYSFLQSDQTVTDGNYPGEPSNSTVHSLGVSFNKNPFVGDITQNWLKSNTTNEDRLTTYVTYSKDIAINTTGFLTLSYENVESTQFEVLSSEPETSLSEDFYGAQAQIQTILPEKNLNVSLTGNYTLYQGVGEADTLSFYSTLVWHIGKLDVNMSASWTNSESTVGDNSTTREYTMIRFTITRKLF